jgi:hypothetical protein
LNKIISITASTTTIASSSADYLGIPGTEDGDRLVVLSTLVERYEGQSKGAIPNMSTDVGWIVPGTPASEPDPLKQSSLTESMADGPNSFCGFNAGVPDISEQ